MKFHCSTKMSAYYEKVSALWKSWHSMKKLASYEKVSALFIYWRSIWWDMHKIKAVQVTVFLQFGLSVQNSDCSSSVLVLGPVKWHLAIRRVPYAKKDFQGPTPRPFAKVMELPSSKQYLLGHINQRSIGSFMYFSFWTSEQWLVQ